ncbi:PrgI family protein [Paenibacillus sp. KQZ6P-2]|uniref:PrgI family protein n=1 Tax=Paenibacillus mangrovi TaxID=2931978 RepID=A0A9X1WK00_9BACL|nr:PrgI family protein [Paenibacillus mangrovi]MCJ8010146.1 PrgI family protein [Paenibacillus mangrovi]
MIEIRIPKEIRTYKEKLFFGLNLRQLICTAIAILINVPLYWFGKDIIGPDAASWVVILIAIPLFMIGFFSYNGMTFEQFIKSVIQFEVIYPQKRKYKTLNMFEMLSSYNEREGKKRVLSKKTKIHREEKDANT